MLRASRVPFEIRADQHEPWHPGRCAAIFVQNEEGHEWLAGHAGELHPRVIAAFGLPARTVAMELDMSVIETAADTLGPVQAPTLSSYPVAVQDVALVVAETVPAADVERALVAGAADAGDVQLEDLRLFDVYTGDQAGRGPQVSRLHPAVACARPDADCGGGDCCQGRSGGRGRQADRSGAARWVAALAGWL